MKTETIKFLRVKLGDSLSEVENFAVKNQIKQQMWTKEKSWENYLKIFIKYLNKSWISFFNIKEKGELLKTIKNLQSAVDFFASKMIE